MRSTACFALAAAASLASCALRGVAEPPPFLHAAAIDQYARFNPAGTTILPTGQFIHPAGRHEPLARWPCGLTLSPDGRTAFIPSQDEGQFVSGWDSAAPVVAQFKPTDASGKALSTSSGGCEFSADGKTLYWSSGDSGGIYCIDVANHAVTSTISLNVPVGGRSFQGSFAFDLKRSGDGRYLYCADVTNFRVAVVDLQAGKVVGSVDVGRYPYALAVDGDHVYVANVGMYRYTAVPPPTSGHFDARGISFPAFGTPSREAETGVDFEGRHIAGLGSPDSDKAFSVWGLDMSDPQAPRVVFRHDCGIPVGAPTSRGPAVGGAAPNFLLVHGADLYISDGNDDLIERIDTRTGHDTMRLLLTPSPLVARLRGVGPAGMAISPDGSRLYVAESGINAVGVIDTRRRKLLGQIPTAWYPYRVAAVDSGRTLLITNFRGFGNGPNMPGLSPNPYRRMAGVLTIVAAPDAQTLAGMTREVLRNDGMVNRSADRAALSSPVIPTTPGVKSPDIKYVVFICKENHTYDTIFDHVPGANGDPSLLRWGYHQTIEASGQPILQDAPVMTNTNKLAREFTVSDNFYLMPEYSGVGHRWLVGIMPDNFCQMLYTLGWNFDVHSTAPGRLASFGSNASMAPEDYPEAGAMWSHLARHGVGFRNYGEGFEFAGVYEDRGEFRTGARESVNIPMPEVLYQNTDRGFPIFNMHIPDQYRAYWFQQDVTKRYLSGKYPMPSFLNVALCNDHGTDPDPAHGYPYVASWMADDDLALGRIVDFLSHTPYWRHMAIFVTEDDTGGEQDHVDAQRSVMLIISPWAKRQYVSHRHTTVVSMHRTLYEILGLPPLNIFDALCNDFSDCFTTHPDFTPYTYVGVDKLVFDPEKAKNPKDPTYMAARREPSIAMDDPVVEHRLLKEEETDDPAGR